MDKNSIGLTENEARYYLRQNLLEAIDKVNKALHTVDDNDPFLSQYQETIQWAKNTILSEIQRINTNLEG